MGHFGLAGGAEPRHLLLSDESEGAMTPQVSNWRVSCTFACPSEGCGHWLEVASKKPQDTVHCPECRAEWEVTWQVKVEPGGHPIIRSN
jgi:hypothetical protein